MAEDTRGSLLQLCEEYLSKNPLSAEIHQYHQFDEVAVDAAIICLHMEAKQRNIPFKNLATGFITESINNLVAKKTEESKLTPKFLIALMSKISNNGDLNHHEIQQHVNKYPSLLPPQLIVTLNQLGVISFTNFFQNGIDSSKKIANWVRCILALTCEPDEEDDVKVLQAIVTAIIGIGFGKLPQEMKNAITSQTVKTSVLMINSLTRKIWDFLWENPDVKVQIFELPQDPDTMSCDIKAIQSCYLEQLAFLFSYKPEIKATVAITSLQEWTYFKSPENVTNFIMQLLLPLDVEKLLEKIADVLIRYEINWKTMLLVVSTIQICFPTGNKLIKDMISSLIYKGIETMQIELILASLLLARQINAETSNSASYGIWFTTAVPTSVSTKQFTFFMKLLSNIVRHEPLWVLVAHRNHPPYVPQVDNCRTVWAEYIALVRTRIEDLKLQIPAEKIIEEDNTVAKEVEAAIASFEKSGRVPTSVIEASIFRKPYFTGKFLPVLLKPRRVPVPLDLREEFIDELRRSGKLPLVQYEAYTSACRELEKQNTDSEMDWKTSDGLPDFKALMDRIAECANEKNKVIQLIEKLSALLTEALPKPGASELLIEFSPDTIELDRKENSLSWDIAESWMCSLDKALGKCESFDWVIRYFQALCPHVSVIKAFYLSIHQYLLQMNNRGKARCFGRVICLVNLSTHLIVPVRYGSFQGDFIDLLFSSKLCVLTKSDSMLFTLEVLSHAVTGAQSLRVLDAIPTVLNVFVWLSRRVRYSSKWNSCYQFSQLSENPEVAQKTIPLKDWLRLEVNVEAAKDVLLWAERSGYLRSILETFYENVKQFELAPSILEVIIDCSTENSTGYIDCSADLLLLLQSHLVSNEDFDSKDGAWLLDFWQSCHEKKGKNVDPVIWSLICALPAYLLCRNSPNGATRDFSLKKLMELVEGSWRNNMMEGVWFPKHVTAHIVRSTNDARLIRALPCLQFSMLIHAMSYSFQWTGCWKTLENALGVFHPLIWHENNASAFSWSGNAETDTLVCQLMFVALVVKFERNVDEEWPWYVHKLGSSILQNPSLLKGCRMASWKSDDYLLPWRKILPDNTMNLLAIVVLKVLISWSNVLKKADSQVTVEYLKVVFAAYEQWIKVSNSFIDTLKTTADESASTNSYSAGNLLDYSTLGKLNRDIKKIISEMPLRAVKNYQQLPEFRFLDSDFQTAMKQRSV